MANEDQKIERQASKGATVTVACKIPNGLKLEVFEEREVHEPLFGGGTKLVKRFERTGKPGTFYTVRGPRLPFGVPPTFPIVGGFALTPGIPKDFWDKYCEQNQDSDAIRNGLLFAHESLDKVQGRCREFRGNKSGLEPLDPEATGKDRDPRVPRAQGNVSGITKAKKETEDA